MTVRDSGWLMLYAEDNQEAIDMHMDIGEKLIQRTKGKLLSIIGEDLFYATMNPAQAALMLYGLPPPIPTETPEVMRQIFVDREKLLEPEFVKILENNGNTVY